MLYPLVIDLAADGIAVALTYRVLGFTKQAFYNWRRNPGTRRDWDDAHLSDAARDIHGDDPTFGYRLVADELAAEGVAVGENRVARLCGQERTWSIHTKKRGLHRKADPSVHDEHVRRVFTAPAPERVWLTDITTRGAGSTRARFRKPARRRGRPLYAPQWTRDDGCR
ncbi:transposase [Kribbella speibonae]|uniref:Transposase n=1 Tax=Kribbella speibonae TaxID=1572660 RepID=A0A4R0ISX1_9ACTN|nr:transposase [Kribbella speibonae]